MRKEINIITGKGAYIAKWEHPTLSKPTNKELT